jgi:hypothetical protein
MKRMLSAAKVGVEIEVLTEHVRKVHISYHDIPYHSFAHATHVTMNCYRMWCESLSKDENFTPLEGVAYVWAGLVHDIEHLGTALELFYIIFTFASNIEVC